MQNKIAILIPYFGKAPLWFDYFIVSCKYNTNIDWLFFTDCLSLEVKIPNLKFVKMTLSEFNTLAESALSIYVDVKNAYKLCDYKPAFGKIFSAYIKEYKFWGYGDIDLIYGDIIKILPENWEVNYDLISNHKSFIPGHLCLLKNTEEVKNLYLNIANYEEILQSDKYWGLDETLLLFPVSTNAVMNKISRWRHVQQHLLLDRIAKFKNRIFSHTKRGEPAKDKVEIDSELKDFTSLIQSKSRKKTIRAFFSTNYSCDIDYSKKQLKDWKVTWDDGSLVDSINQEEIMYFHFQLSKMKRCFKIKPLNPSASKFYISPKGIDCEI